jgi:large subunit ribosomal protein L5
VEEAPPPEVAAPAKRVPRLLEQYHSQVKETLKQEFEYPNVMQIPRVQKVVLNIGVGETKVNPRALESATRDLTLIAAQKPITTRARRSIAGFKLREGDPIGVAVTLRGNRMYDFMDRLFNAALPRIRDFRGVSRHAFDGRGNYSLGIREQVIFPEIDYGQIDRVRSFQVSLITTAPTDGEAMRLLELLGMPFARDGTGARG